MPTLNSAKRTHSPTLGRAEPGLTAGLAVAILLSLLFSAIAVPAASPTPSAAPSVPTGPPPLTLAAIEGSPPAPVPAAHDWPSTAAARGAYTGTLNVLVEFHLANTSALAAFDSAVSTPSNPLYGQYLTEAQFAKRFGAPGPTYAAAVTYFSSFVGVHVTTYPDHISLKVTGRASTVGTLFGVSIQRFATPTESFYAPVGVPTLPAALARTVADIVGLDDYAWATLPSPGEVSGSSVVRGPVMPRAAADAASGPLTVPQPSQFPAPVTLKNGVQRLWGSDFQVTYGALPLFSAGYPTSATIVTVLWAGNTVANYSGSPTAPWNPADISTYFNQTLPPGEPHSVVIGLPVNGAVPPGPSAANDTTGAVEENTLDIEMAGTVAPGATIYSIYGPKLPDVFAAFVAAFSLPNGVTPNVISNSWGTIDADLPFLVPYLEEATARGITILAATGDSGDNPASSKWYPNNPSPDGVGLLSTMAYNGSGLTAVGGTTLVVNPNNASSTYLQIQSEVTWYEETAAGPVGTIGGVSRIFSEPNWQVRSSANKVILAAGEGPGRGVPDIAAVANNTLIGITFSRGYYNAAMAGTSVASPVVAGLVASVDAWFAATGRNYGRPLGYLNPLLYSLGDAQQNGSLSHPPFYDVTVGRNHLYSALPGWDLVTGWGSLNATALALNFPMSYPVTFHENGTTAPWGVTIVNSTGTAVVSPSSTAALLRVGLPNGTYTFRVNAPSGYQVASVSLTGPIVVAHGAATPTTIWINFTTTGSGGSNFLTQIAGYFAFLTVGGIPGAVVFLLVVLLLAVVVGGAAVSRRRSRRKAEAARRAADAQAAARASIGPMELGRSSGAEPPAAPTSAHGSDTASSEDPGHSLPGGPPEAPPPIDRQG